MEDKEKGSVEGFAESYGCQMMVRRGEHLTYEVKVQSGQRFTVAGTQESTFQQSLLTAELIRR